MNRKRVVSLLLSTCIIASSCVSMSGLNALAAENESGGSTDAAVMQEDTSEEETPDAETDETPSQGGTTDNHSETETENEEIAEAEDHGNEEIVEDENHANEEIVETEDQTDDAAETVTEDEVQDDPSDSESEEIVDDTITVTSTADNMSTADTDLEKNIVDSGTCGDNATWELAELNGAYYLTIGGYGAISVQYDEYPWESYDDSIVGLEIGFGITEIAPGAFDDISQLTEIVIPDSVAVIERCAFENCDSLQSVVMSQNIERIDYSAFKNCPIGRLELPVSLRSIGTEAVSYSDTVVYYAGTEDAWDRIIKHYWIVCKEIIYGNQEVPWLSVTSGTCGENAQWALTGEGDDLTLTITGSGDMKDYDYDNEPLWANRSEKIRTIIISDDITSIGAFAFRGCKNVTDVDIPDGVTSINYDAFASCGLTSVDIPNKVQKLGACCFEACRSLESIIVPNSVTELGHYAFAECSALTSVTIPGSFTYIGDWPFDGSGNISEVIINGEASDYLISRMRGMFRKTNWWKSLGDLIVIDNKLIGYEGSDKTVVIPDGVTEIMNSVFSENHVVERIVIPSSVTHVGSAFSECTALKEINLPSSQTRIEDWTFSKCTSLEHIEMPENLISIGSWAFSDCTSLKEITIPYGVTEIGEFAFVDCNSLKKADIPDTVTTIDNDVFNRCYGLTSINIPNGVKNLQGVFGDCTGLTSIVIPNSVESIGYDTFGGCSNLVTLVIPESVTTISPQAFGYDASERSADLVVYGVKGSVAESYCEDHDIDFSYMNELPDVKILTQPEDVKASAGEKVTFHVEVQGDNPTYQWQWSTDGKNWKNCTSGGCKTDTFSFNMKETVAGRRYRCVITFSRGKLITVPADLELGTGGKIVSQPEDFTASVGEKVTFHVEYQGGNPSYQWQWSSNGTTWKNCTSGGYKTDTFSFVMKATVAGRQYRCVITDGTEKVISDAAVISMQEKELEITEQPADTEVAVGETVVFHVEADGNSPTYQWQWSSNGITWKNCTSGGYKTDTFSFTMKSSVSGRKYRCIVTDGDRKLTSREATITMKEGLKITTQPEDVQAAVGETVEFHVEANKPDVTYQWQYSANGTTWKNCTSGGYNTDTFSFKMKATVSGRQYRCKVTCGTERLTSDAGVVTLK